MEGERLPRNEYYVEDGQEEEIMEPEMAQEPL